MNTVPHRDSLSRAQCNADCPLRSSVVEEAPERGSLWVWKMVVAAAPDWRLGSGVSGWVTGAG